MPTIRTVKALTLDAITPIMAVGGTKQVLIGNPHKANGYFLGHDGTNPVSTGSGFATVSDMEQVALTLVDNPAYLWTLTRDSDTEYSIKVNGYDPSGTSGSNATWTTDTTEYQLSDASTVGLAYTSDMSENYSTSNCIRLCLSSDTSTYLNAGGALSSLRYATGRGEWSVWYLYEPTTTTTIQVTSDARNGTISPSGTQTVSEGQSVTFTMTPNTNGMPVLRVNGTRVTPTKYTARVTDAGVALMHMDTGVSDELGNVTPTTSGSGAVQSSVTKFGTGAFQFDGSSYIRIPFTPSGSAWSIEMWVYRTSTNTSGYYPTVFSTNAISSTGGVYMHTDNGAYGTYPIYRANASSGGYNNGTAGTEVLTANEWHHVEYDRSGDSNYFFVDGDLKATVTQADPISVTSIYLGVLWGQSTFVARTYFTGYMDEVLIADRCRHTSSFTPPAIPYSTTEETGYRYVLNDVRDDTTVHVTFTDWWYRRDGTWHPVSGIWRKSDGTWRPIGAILYKGGGSWAKT